MTIRLAPVTGQSTDRSPDSPVTATARTIAELHQIRDAAARANAAAEYIAAGEAKLTEARQLRDAAIAQLITTHGVTAAARACGVSITHAKQVRATR